MKISIWQVYTCRIGVHGVDFQRILRIVFCFLMWQAAWNHFQRREPRLEQKVSVCFSADRTLWYKLCTKLKKRTIHPNFEFQTHQPVPWRCPPITLSLPLLLSIINALSLRASSLIYDPISERLSCAGRLSEKAIQFYVPNRQKPSMPLPGVWTCQRIAN